MNKQLGGPRISRPPKFNGGKFMKKVTVARVAAFALVFLGTFLLPLKAQAGGKVRVYNELQQVIHPWFKCPASAVAVPSSGCSTTGWNYFGVIDADGEFEWGFSAYPGHYSFTYTLDLTPPKDRVEGDIKASFYLDSSTNVVIQIGKRLKAFELEGPDSQ